MISIILVKYSEVGLVDHMVVPFLIILGIFILFSIEAVPFWILNNSIEGLQFLHILTNTFWSLSLSLSDNRHPNGCEVRLHCGFDLQFADSDVEHLFIYKLVVCISLEKCLVKSLVFLHKWIMGGGCFTWFVGIHYIFYKLIPY